MTEDVIDLGLDVLVSAAEAMEPPVPLEKSLAITLVVSGGLITGRLIPGEQWMREVGRSPEQATKDEDGMLAPCAEAIRGRKQREKELDELWEKDESQLTEEDKQEYRDLSMHHFIHLVDARFMAGSAGLIPHNQGEYMRVRVNAVSAWMMGILGTAPRQDVS